MKLIRPVEELIGAFQTDKFQWEEGDAKYLLIADRQTIHQDLREIFHPDSTMLTVYLRSKHSPDCSRGENENEINIPMLEVNDILQALDNYFNHE